MRDSASKESIAARMRNQKLMNSISNGETLPEVDAVISNVGTLSDLHDATIEVIEKLYGNL